MEAGRLDDGRIALTEGLTVAKEHEERVHEAEIYQLKGELLLMQDRSTIAQAQSCFLTAIQIA